MNKVKNYLHSFMIAIVMFGGILIILDLGMILKDCMGKRKITDEYEKVVAANYDKIEEIWATEVWNMIGDGKVGSIKFYARQNGFEYLIATNNDFVYSSDGYYTMMSDDERIFNKDAYTIYIKTIDKDSILAKYPKARVWVFFSRKLWLVVIGLIFGAGLFVGGAYLLIMNDSIENKLGLIIVNLLFLELLCCYFFKLSRAIILLSVLEKLFFGLGVEYYLYYLRKIQRKIQNYGDEENETFYDVKSFPLSMRSFAKQVEDASNSVSIAVNERLKSERMKTELITNVSHDIKTPLTSIINFSDFIIKEKSENKAIMEYAERLHSQSLKLKDLLDSLIEASKASTGALEIHTITCNVKTMLEQCIVEYEEKLKNNDITLVEVPVEGDVKVQADVKALSRIFDNLLTNICKYAMPNSRAYIVVKNEEDGVEITFKNIAKEPTNYTSDELLERFVRGDESRHTEGHGLGLSIVKSLMDLMGGRVELSAEYDVFEVKLYFKPWEKD